MHINSEFKELVFKRATVLCELDLAEGILDESLGELKVYIEKKPLFCIYSALIEINASNLLGGKKIYVGADAL